MERHNIWRIADQRATPDRNHRWRESRRGRFRPARRPVAIDRPAAEQTWPAPLTVRTAPPRMVADDAHPGWPAHARPAVPVYQRRLDRYTDGIARSFRAHNGHHAVAGRHRGWMSRRRPLALMDAPRMLGRGSAAHYRAVFANVAPHYRRLRSGGQSIPGKGMGEMMRDGVKVAWNGTVLSPRHAVIAMVAVIVLVMSTVGAGLAQQRYVVQSGDTIGSIASTFGVNPEGIRRSSYLPSGDDLQTGQVLVIPDPGQSPAEAAQMAARLEGTSPWVQTAHRVESGETLAGIAAYYGLDPLALADFNGIADSSSIMPGERILIPAASDGAAQTAVAPSEVTVPGVITYYQRHNLSCEYAAAHIATAMFGAPIDEGVFINNVPQAVNPHYGYRGDIDGWWGNTDDYGVYPEALVPVLNDRGFAAEVLYTGGDTGALTAQLDAGHPVVVWLGFRGDTRVRLSDDGNYSVAAGTHVVTVYGYDNDGVYVSDPASGTLDYYSWGDFVWMWKVLDGMSMAVYPF